MLLRALLAYTTLGSATLAACVHAPDSPVAGAPAAIAATPGPAPLAVAAEAVPTAFCADGEHVLACTVLTPDQPVHHMAMAVSGRSIGIGWTTQGSSWVSRSESGPAYFEILDERITRSHGLELPGYAVYDIAVAAGRSGWLVATAEVSATVVHHVGLDGTIDGPSLRLPGSVAPHLVVEPSGDVLLVRTGASGTQAALLTSLDAPPRWDVVLVEHAVEPRFSSAVAVDGGFLVSLRGPEGIEVVRLERDGSIGARQRQMGSSTEYPKLASCGRDARMVWADFSSQGMMRWARLDGRGASSDEPSTLGVIPEYFDPSPLLCDGHDSIVLLGGYTGGTGVASHLELVRVDAGGHAGERLPVLGAPYSAYDWRIDALDGDMVVSWIALQGSIGVARARAPRSGAAAIAVPPES